jgi:hypothetical protein
VERIDSSWGRSWRSCLGEKMAGEDRFRWGRSCLEEKMVGEDRFRWGTTGESRSGFKISIGVSMSFCYFFTWSENVPDVLQFCTEGVFI